jgi:hypothetical protein
VQTTSALPVISGSALARAWMRAASSYRVKLTRWRNKGRKA